MRWVKRTVKVAVANCLYATGVLQFCLRRSLRRRAVALMYHRILSPAERAASGSHPAYIVDTQTFAMHLDVLRRRFRVISPAAFAQHLEHDRPFADSTCLITFDDGWKDNLSNALPLLDRLELPVLVFLPVNFIGERRMFWREAVTHLLVRAVAVARRDQDRHASLTALLATYGLADVLDLPDENLKESILSLVLSRTQRRMASAESLIEALSAALSVRVEDLETPDRFVTWDEAAQMADRRVYFGGHGAEHRLLAELDASDAQAEVTASKAALERLGRATIPAFSYPNGSFNSSVIDAVRAAGYRLAFTIEPGSIAADDDRFTLKRINIHEDATSTEPLFLARLVGLF